jgi:NTE family protein
MAGKREGETMSRTVGVALGSGGARGWAHIGVLRILEEAGIAPAIVAGTSVGAVIGALHVAGRLPDFAQFTRRFNRIRLSQYFDFKLGAGGIIGGGRVLKALEQQFRDATIEALPRKFACVATDLGSGDEVWLRSGPVLAALSASYAIPGLFPPAHIDGRWLVDGALVNPVPVSLCRALGADLVIAVDVNAGILAPMRADEHQIALAETGAAGARGPDFARGYFRRRKGGPSTFGVITRSLQISQTRLSRIRLAEDPPEILLHPEVGHIGPLDFHRAGECIAAGEHAMARALPAVTEALAAAARPARDRPARGTR